MGSKGFLFFRFSRDLWDVVREVHIGPKVFFDFVLVLSEVVRGWLISEALGHQNG